MHQNSLDNEIQNAQDGGRNLLPNRTVANNDKKTLRCTVN